MEYVLVTGGAGYIGSHTLVSLIEAGYEIIVIDNLFNASEEALRRVAKITGRPKVDFYNIDLNDKDKLEGVFEKYAGKIKSVIHFAGYKAVGESVGKPLEYYHNNVGATVSLLSAMKKYGVKNFIFSSSATVYGQALDIPETGLNETLPTGATSPYARTKYFIEQILEDLCVSDSDWKVISLRYFNPAGAHPSGMMGENPKGIPNNLMPYLGKVVLGQISHLNIFGNDYPTKDGTGVRDYIHIMDLAEGHVAALKHIDKISGWEAFNLGSGVGLSVLDMVSLMKEATGKDIPHKFAERRPGDVPVLVCDPRKATEKLKWWAKRTPLEIMKDFWNWQNLNPSGYE